MARSLLLALAFLCTAACASAEDPRRRVLLAWGTEFLLPNYRELKERTRELEQASADLCADASAKAWTRASRAWWAARAPLKRTEMFAFGPYTLPPWRLGPKLDSWPVRPAGILELLAGSEPISADALGAFHRGFPAIEFLLHEPGIGPPDFVKTSRRCEYLLVLTKALAKDAKALLRAWDPAGENYLAELAEAGEASHAFQSLHEALGEVVNRMGFLVENIRADKLGRPLGNVTGGSPEPNKAESHLSGRTVEDIRDNLEGLELLFFGPPGGGGPSLEKLVRARGRDLRPEMGEALKASRNALDQIPEPLTEAVANDPQSVALAIERLAELERVIQIDLLGALALAQTFNDNDGD